MAERKYYVLCDANCKFEGMTKEQILTAIEQAVNDGEIADIDSGFVTKLKEQNKGVGLNFWVGTQAEYNALEEKPNNTFCIITDDTQKEDLQAAIEIVREDMQNLADWVGNVESDVNALETVVNSQEDYVIEDAPGRVQGELSYRKWKSGILEFWKTETITTKLDYSWGAGYTKEADEAGNAKVFYCEISIPTNTKFTQIFTHNVDVEAWGHFVFAHSVECKAIEDEHSTYLKVMLWSPTPITEEIELKIHFSVRGRWN